MVLSLWVAEPYPSPRQSNPLVRLDQSAPKRTKQSLGAPNVPEPSPISPLPGSSIPSSMSAASARFPRRLTICSWAEHGWVVRPRSQIRDPISFRKTSEPRGSQNKLLNRSIARVQGQMCLLLAHRLHAACEMASFACGTTHVLSLITCWLPWSVPLSKLLRNTVLGKWRRPDEPPKSGPCLVFCSV